VGEAERLAIKLFVLHAGQCARKKCTALKLARFGKARLLGGPFFPPGTLLLDPFSPRLLSRADLPLAERKGLLAVDCSWDLADRRSFDALLRHRRAEPRSLPYLLASNPVKFGQPYRLSTLEALAAALMMLGRRGQAEELLGLYTWGPRFLELNSEPLDDYAAAGDETEVRAAQCEYSGGR
jgi:pre-rRNA-processing protein TSR3